MSMATVARQNTKTRQGTKWRRDDLLLPVNQSLVFVHWEAGYGVRRSAFEWVDLINSDVLAETVDTDKKPVRIGKATPNGTPAIRFDGTDDRVRLASFTRVSAEQDVDWWIVCKRNATGAAQRIFEFDGANVRTLLSSDDSDNVRALIEGNVGLNQEFEDNATLMDAWRMYKFEVYPSSGSSEAMGYYDSALTRFDTLGTQSNNTDATQGSGELSVGEHISATGGSNFSGDIALIAATDPAAVADSEIASKFVELYGVP